MDRPLDGGGVIAADSPVVNVAASARDHVIIHPVDEIRDNSRSLWNRFLTCSQWTSLCRRGSDGEPTQRDRLKIRATLARPLVHSPPLSPVQPPDRASNAPIFALWWNDRPGVAWLPSTKAVNDRRADKRPPAVSGTERRTTMNTRTPWTRRNSPRTCPRKRIGKTSARRFPTPRT